MPRGVQPPNPRQPPSSPALVLHFCQTLGPEPSAVSSPHPHGRSAVSPEGRCQGLSTRRVSSTGLLGPPGGADPRGSRGTSFPLMRLPLRGRRCPPGSIVPPRTVDSSDRPWKTEASSKPWVCTVSGRSLGNSWLARCSCPAD